MGGVEVDGRLPKPSPFWSFESHRQLSHRTPTRCQKTLLQCFQGFPCATVHGLYGVVDLQEHSPQKDGHRKPAQQRVTLLEERFQGVAGNLRTSAYDSPNGKHWCKPFQYAEPGQAILNFLLNPNGRLNMGGLE